MHVDDDTELPDDFVFDEAVWKDPRRSAEKGRSNGAFGCRVVRVP